uniref:Uncharacterized protein LOC104230873 n=1 Tax=Nicotiana sylvestris TaxID=4096 RepID=A0A1U7WXN7_NICSY|nr:PREDICTED: uncharacterized protein LOC104230873 [Nicotiana sylvestris]
MTISVSIDATAATSMTSSKLISSQKPNMRSDFRFLAAVLAFETCLLADKGEVIVFIECASSFSAFPDSMLIFIVVSLIIPLISSGACNGVTIDYTTQVKLEQPIAAQEKEQLEICLEVEVEKAFYWDSSIDSAVQIQWERRVERIYSDFVNKLKANMVQPDTIPNNVWESWSRLWKHPKCVEKSEINAKNHCGGSEIATGTHTCGSISVGEHRKRLAVKKGRDPTPNELHLHVRTHGNDGKSFVTEKSRIVHEKYQEILQ